MTVFLFLTRHVVVFALFCLVATCPLYAQMRVGHGGAPDGSAVIDINGGPYKTGSPYRGILPPKVALVQSDQATPVQNPAVGLLVYNTAKENDVVPGYYYWDGSKWTRLSTASTGSARVAAVTAGTPVPEYTVAQVRSFTTAPSSYTDAAPPIFMLVEEGKEGLFRYSPELTYADPSHPELYAQDDGVMILVTAGRSSRGDRTTYRRVYDSEINVRWFGAKGDGTTDDSKAIQAAIDYARSKNKLPGQYPLFAGGGGLYRTTVLIPEGNYLINKTLDVTNANGLVIKGVGGRYINTTLVGNSKGAIIDFTGSIMSGCENLTFSSNPAYPDASTIGVLFALGPNGNGGLNCTIDNCFFQLLDNPSANNGIGTIGIINCRSEEFSVTSCLIKANLGIILTNQSSLAAVGYNYTIQSAYTTIATGTGSMGVVNFSGQNSIQNYGIKQPGLILNGTNAVNFHGYIGRASGSGADTTAAIVCSSQQTFNVSVNATVESFSQLLRLRGAFENCTINATVANQADASKPVIDATNAKIEGCKIQVSFGNVSERYNRYLVYHAPVGVGSGTLPAAGLIRNSEIISTHLLDNNLAVSANLLRNSDNVTFHTEFPFEKKGGIIRQLFTHPVSAGTVGSNASATILRIRPADVGTDGNTPNAGYYQIFIRGVVTAGYNATGGYAACPFTATITMSQAQNRGKAPIMTNVVMQGQSTISPSYESINAISVNLDASDPNVYKVLVTPSVTGSGSAENLTVDATVEVKSNFSVNDVIIYP